MKTRILLLVRNEEGAVSVEYAILASLIAGVVVGAVTIFGQTLRDTLFGRALDILP